MRCSFASLSIIAVAALHYATATKTTVDHAVIDDREERRLRTSDLTNDGMLSNFRTQVVTPTISAVPTTMGSTSSSPVPSPGPSVAQPVPLAPPSSASSASPSMSGSAVQSSTSLPSSGPTVDDDVIDIRFNKITYINGIPPPGNNPLPMTAADYPVTLQTAEFLRQTHAVSVIQQDDCRECDIPPEDLLRAIGGLPSQPPFRPNPNDPYWAQLLEVIQVQQGRLDDADPRLFMPLPRIWDDYDIHQVAEAVHDEFPGVYHIELMIQLMGEGMTVDRDIIPSDNQVDFLRSVVVLAELNTWAIGSVGPQNFGIKWYGGRARPEEVAYLIKTGAIPSHHVPMEIRTALENMDFDTATAFTAYPEGSPKHPSWPAMHSAASAGSMWMGVVMNLTPEQWCETKAVDYGVAYARTVAGVHFPDDNIAGLNLGQELVARKLPGYLAARYGSDPAAVRKKILEMRFDWADYLTSDCFAS